MPRPEETIEKKFVSECDKLGVKAIKLEVQGDKGWPDRLVLLPFSRVLFIEFKAPGGKTSIHQEMKFDLLNSYGHKVYIFDNYEKAIELVEQYL